MVYEMNNKLLINVYVPLIEKEYDVFIPINKKVEIVKKMIINSIIDLTYGIYKPTDNLYLYNRDNGKKINDELYVKEASIGNGDELILF